LRLRDVLIVVLVGTVAVVGPGLLPARLAGSYPTGGSPVPDTVAALELFQKRVDEDPNAINLTVLAQLHTRRSRETGNVAELASAESAVRDALAQQPSYGPAALTLASVLAGQHRFGEALTAARRAQHLDPRLGALGLVGDVLVATGDYEGARDAYSQLGGAGSSPGLGARLAHLDELEGDLEGAIRRTERAAAAALEQGGVGEEAAWFQVRLGDLNFTVGKLAESDRRYRAALDLLPDYWPALAGRGKVSAARGDLARAVEFYQSAAAMVPRPEVMIALGDIYSITGDLDLARDSYATVEVISQLSAGVYDRNLALYEAEHGNPEKALALAETGLKERQDVYAYDTLAWALHKSGRYTEARQAMDRAMSLGTRDPNLLFHSGAIWLALGNKSNAGTDLGAALELNPRFHPRYAPEAMKLLAQARA
jgi:tetratricopeptide (TPR) repeat protein